jgi:hypothetical protein
MKHRHPSGAYIAVLLLVALLVSCNQSQRESTAAPRPAALSTTASEKVFVIFEGPWAFVADPKDPDMVLALAPKTKSHRDLNVSASNDVTLAAGVYELSVPSHGVPTTAALDPTFAQAKIDAKNLQRALDDKSGRYVIRLPKPEAYAAAGRRLARVGTTYPPDASSEQKYANQVSLRYTVSSPNGFSLGGTPDTGTFNPFLFQIDTPAIRFMIAPVANDPADACSMHSRQAFRDLVKFLSLTLYVDFPDEAGDCHQKDPQTSSVKAEAPGTVHRRGPAYAGSLAEVELGDLEHFLLTAMYFFHAGGPACKAPILFLTVS